MGRSENCSPSRPCLMCGKPDWCNIVTFPNGDVLAYCQRMHGNKGETAMSVSGKAYIARKDTDAGFTVWEPLEQYEANRKAFLAEKYPDGKKGYKKQNYKKADQSNYQTYQKRNENVIGLVKVADPNRLNEVYSALLDILVLEDKHECKLRSEWDQYTGLFANIMAKFPIKSLPPEDRVRFSSREKLKNPSRKKIMELLVERVGEPLGVPGFYQRQDGKWTLHPLCGIVYPEYDTLGRIIRLRIGTDYSQVKGELDGIEGSFSYMALNDTAGWYFIPEGTRNAKLVWEYGGVNNLITLNKKGYPEGKVKAKYMNFTSYKAVEKPLEDGTIQVYNKYNNGCESSSYASLYTTEGDDPTFVYITEGEKKAIVANTIMNVPTISLPGVNSFKKLFENESGEEKSMIDSLIGKGAKGFVLVFDADKSVNEAVLHHEQSAVEEFKKRNLLIAIGEWNPNWGKGLDDVLLTGVMPDVHFVK